MGSSSLGDTSVTAITWKVMFTPRNGWKWLSSSWSLSGIGVDRVKLRWVSAAEGQLFANLVKELSGVMQAMGPFDLDRHKLPLAAVEGALNSPRLRWLMGMERQLIEHENVYHLKLDEANYKQLLKVAVEEEYQKALILEVLNAGPQSVREIAAAKRVAGLHHLDPPE